MDSRTTGARASLVVRAGSVRLAIPLSAVRETLRAVARESLSGVPEFVVGVSLIRGLPTPVVDTGFLLGNSNRESAGRLVLVRGGRSNIALAVDEVLGVRKLGADVGESLPPLLAGNPAVAGLGRIDASLLVVLEAARIIPDEAWTALHARERG